MNSATASNRDYNVYCILYTLYELVWARISIWHCLPITFCIQPDFESRSFQISSNTLTIFNKNCCLNSYEIYSSSFLVPLLHSRSLHYFSVNAFIPAHSQANFHLRFYLVLSFSFFFFDQFVLYCFDSFFSSRLNRQVIVPNPNTPSATIAYENEQPNNKHIIMNCLRDCCTEFEQKPTTTTSPDMSFTQKKPKTIKTCSSIHSFLERRQFFSHLYSLVEIEKLIFILSCQFTFYSTIDRMHILCSVFGVYVT